MTAQAYSQNMPPRQDDGSSPQTTLSRVLPLVCLAVSFTSLAGFVYMLGYSYQAADRWVVLPLLLAGSTSFALALLCAFTGYGPARLTLPAAFLCFLALMATISIGPHTRSLKVASENLNGQDPALVSHVSHTVRQNPFNVFAMTQALLPITNSSLRQSDVELFRQAHQAGLSSPAIDRVLANGFVRPDDKNELLIAVLHNNSTDTQTLALALGLVDSL